MTRDFLQLTGIRYPIVQAPMLGVTTPEMVAAISEAGGLGSLPVGGLSPEKTEELIRQTRRLTTKPFAVNLFAHTLPPAPDLQPMKEFLDDLAGDLGVEVGAELPARHYTYADQTDVLLKENIRLISFTFGVPDDGTLARFKAAGVVLNGTATSVTEAEFLESRGVDVITVQGIEAGGHRGTFLSEEPLPQIGLMALLPAVVERVSRPVLAAGAISSGKAAYAALVLGAAGVQVGTLFVASHESKAIDAWKQQLQDARDTDTVLTRAFSGRWARGLRNEMQETIEKSGIPIPDYPYQNSLSTALRQEAQKRNDGRFTHLWAGQYPSKAPLEGSAVIFNRLLDELIAVESSPIVLS